jgi:hypothetical protein
VCTYFAAGIAILLPGPSGLPCDGVFSVELGMGLGTLCCLSLLPQFLHACLLTSFMIPRALILFLFSEYNIFCVT